MTDELVALREASFVAEADLVPAGKGRDEYVMTIMSKQVLILLALLVLSVLVLALLQQCLLVKAATST